MVDHSCHTPNTTTKIFFFSFNVFSSRNRIPELLWGLTQTFPSLILPHVIVGYDHRPYQKGASGFRNSGNRDASVPPFPFESLEPESPVSSGSMVQIVDLINGPD